MLMGSVRWVVPVAMGDLRKPGWSLAAAGAGAVVVCGVGALCSSAGAERAGSVPSTICAARWVVALIAATSEQAKVAVCAKRQKRRAGGATGHAFSMRGRAGRASYTGRCALCGTSSAGHGEVDGKEGDSGVKRVVALCRHRAVATQSGGRMTSGMLSHWCNTEVAGKQDNSAIDAGRAQCALACKHAEVRLS